MFDLRFHGETAWLTLTRPDSRNAIPAEDWRALARAVAGAAGARLLVVRGAGTAFCAGADVSDFAAMEGRLEACARFRRDMRDGVEALAGLPIPVIAAIHGPCYGAGVALAMACDIRLAGPAARFAITPARFGISYPQKDVHRLVALVGPGQASRLLLTAQPVDAAEALRIGLVDLLAEDWEAEIEILAAALLAGSGESHAVLKRAIRVAGLGTASDDEQDRRFDALLASGDFAARLAPRGGKG